MTNFLLENLNVNQHKNCFADIWETVKSYEICWIQINACLGYGSFYPQQFGSLDPDPDPRGKTNHQKQKKHKSELL